MPQWLTAYCSEYYVTPRGFGVVLSAPHSSVQCLMAALCDRINSRHSRFFDVLFRRCNMFRALGKFSYFQ